MLFHQHSPDFAVLDWTRRERSVSPRLRQGRDPVNVSSKLDPLACPSKLLEMEPDKPKMAKGYVVDRAIDGAPFILERIDKRWVTT